MNKREVVLLVDSSRLEKINPFIVKVLPYLVKKEMRSMSPHIHMLNCGNINIDRYYKNYMEDMSIDEREAYNAFIKHVHTMVIYTTNKLLGVLDCVYKQKHNYIVLHLKERK